jgi:transposase
MTTKLTVVGLDVCKDRVVACLLTELPSSPQEFYQEYEFPEFPLTRKGFEALMALKPDVVVYEPTGMAYSQVWVTRLNAEGVKTMAVDHAKLRAYRKGLGLPDKDDPADSLALTCYYLDPLKQSKYSFVRNKEPVIQQIRSLVLRLQHLDRLKNVIVNRLKQDLAIDFPEQMNKDVDDAPLFWRWLAGKARSVKYDRLMADSIGLGIRQETRWQAFQLLEVFAEERSIEARIRPLLLDDRFAPYLRVFRKFQFGDRISWLLLSQLFPLADFLKDGRSEVKLRKSRKTGRTNSRHLSLRRFQKAIGVAPVREESGDLKKRHRGGSSLCRKALWLWCFTIIEPKKRRGGSPLVQELRACYNRAAADFERADITKVGIKPEDVDRRAKGIRIKLARAYLRRKASVALFRELVKELE